MLLPLVSKARMSFWLRIFRRSNSGSAAIEFAMIAPVFFALLFAIMETGLVFLGGQMLETGVQDASRLFYTSQAPSKADYTAAICGRISALMDCSNIKVDVRAYNPGTAISVADPIDSGGNLSDGMLVWQPPTTSSQTVVSRGFYAWPLYVTGLGYNIANIGRGTNNSKRLLAATNATGPQ